MEAKPTASQRVAGVNRNLIDRIGELLEAKTGLMLNRIKFDMATNAKELKTDCASLRNNVVSLVSDIASLESELKSDSASLKSELKAYSESLKSELKSDMVNALKDSHIEIMGHVEILDSRVTKIENRW